MKIALLQNDKSFLSFDLKDLLWLILVVGVWASVDYRSRYSDTLLKYYREYQTTISRQKEQLDKVIDSDEVLLIYLDKVNDDYKALGKEIAESNIVLANCHRAFEYLHRSLSEQLHT